MSGLLPMVIVLCVVLVLIGAGFLALILDDRRRAKQTQALLDHPAFKATERKP